MASLFGDVTNVRSPRTYLAGYTRTSTTNTSLDTHETASPDQPPSTPGGVSVDTSTTFVEEWKDSIYSLRGHPTAIITSIAIDNSTYALLTLNEDPLRTTNGDPNIPSPSSTPVNKDQHIHIPGNRARLIAVGTNTGVVLVWNARGPQPTNTTIPNELHPLRTICSDSPQVSCLALSALCLVVGGNDGLVQAWDPLASTLQPIRTLNSRFSSRARRRLIQAEASIHGVGINHFAAGAIVLDPDPTVLRGMVSLGTHLRYWSYSSSTDQYQSRKRRLRRAGERGSNSGPDRFTNTGRGALMDYIATEQEELKKEKLRRSREEARLKGRFGVGLGGLSEEEALRYAEMVSAESFEQDELRRMSDNTSRFSNPGDASSSQSVWSSSATITPEGSERGPSLSPGYKPDDEFENDIEEAIRLSLLGSIHEAGRPPVTSGSGEHDIPITYKRKKPRSNSSSPSTSQSSRTGIMSNLSTGRHAAAIDDLDFALQLSLAEAQSRRVANIGVNEQEEDFPVLESRSGVRKGKGRAH